MGKVSKFYHLKMALGLTALMFLLSSCSMSGDITNLNEEILKREEKPRIVPDYLHAEMVKTVQGTPNYSVNGVFLEISEAQTTTVGTTGYKVEGVFQ